MTEPVVFTCRTCGAKGDPPPCDHFMHAWTAQQIAEAHQKLLEMCPECAGIGEILDAPDRVLDGRPYRTRCPVCRGTGSLDVT